SSGSTALLPAIAGVDRKLVASGPPAWLEILRENFDSCVDFTRNDRSSLLARFSRAKIRIASERRKQRTIFRSRAYNTFVAAPLRQLHTIDYHLKLLEPLGISGEAPAISLEIPEKAQTAASNLIGRSGTQNPFIVFHPGSARPEKFWEPDRWVEL